MRMLELIGEGCDAHVADHIIGSAPEGSEYSLRKREREREGRRKGGIEKQSRRRTLKASPKFTTQLYHSAFQSRVVLFLRNLRKSSLLAYPCGDRTLSVGLGPTRGEDFKARGRRTPFFPKSSGTISSKFAKSCLFAYPCGDILVV